MKNKILLTPGWTIFIGVILSIIFWLILHLILVNVIYYIFNDTSFYQKLETGDRKILVYGIGSFLSLVTTIFFFIFGLGESHEIPELEECKKRTEEIRKRQIERPPLGSPPLLNWPATAKADFVPPDGFTGFYLWLGNPVHGIFLSAGNHWKIPIFMSIRIVQTAPVSSEFSASAPSKIRKTVSASTPGVIELKELAGSIRFTARGLITYSVYAPITYFELDDSTKQLKLLSYVHEGCRNHIKKSTPEDLLNETSREQLVESLDNLIEGIDGDGTTIEEIGLQVSESHGINLEDLEPTDPVIRESFESVSKTQLKEFGDQIKYDNHGLGIERLKLAGVTDLNKASENILAMDSNAKMNVERKQEQIEFVGGAKDGETLIYLLRKFFDKK